jgi:hypothetical protein
MKYEKEFNEWWLNFPYIPTPQSSFMDLENAKHGWSAAIEFMEFKKCEECKWFENLKNDKDYGTCNQENRACGAFEEVLFNSNYCCKYWEGKE